MDTDSQSRVFTNANSHFPIWNQHVENQTKFESMIKKKNHGELSILLEYAKTNNVKPTLISKLEFTIECLSDRK